MKTALEELAGRPEARQVHLELGYLHHELGDFDRARREYDRVTKSDNVDSYARAARLNRANIDAESGAVERARVEYDALLSLDFADAVTRHSRAILSMRMGQPDRAEKDLSVLLEMGESLKKPGEILAARARARLQSGRITDAIADASEARRIHPCPAHDRLWQRVLLSAHRFDRIQLERPEAAAQLPLGGRKLIADLQAATIALARRSSGGDEAAYRANLTRAVILAALGKQAAAVAAASQALALSRFSADAYLIRARIRAFGGDREGAAKDVERGLAIRPDEPGLIELHGDLLHAAGDDRGAIENYNRLIASGARDGINMRKAEALVAQGNHDAAVMEWSMALRRDPERPEAFLGRARAYIQLRKWDLAVADLEQAASWAHSDPRIEFAVVAAYLRCMGNQPDRLPRILTVARRAADDTWRSLDGRLQPPTAPR